jgi:glycosyltransferase involved in cell wall biosynthesis
MLLSNAHKPDPRVAREARALTEAGYGVTAVCWDRQAELAPRESRDGVEILRIQNVRSAYAAGWRQLFYLPRFWREASALTQRLQPDIVHCHDLDTLYVGRRIKTKLGTTLVYDAHEHYPALMSLYLPRPLVSALVRWEHWLVRGVDATITASTVLRDEFLSSGVHAAPVITLGNYANLAPFAAVTKDQMTALRSRLGVPSGELLVSYIGGFSRNRLLLPLIEAAQQLPHVHFHIWGDGPQRSSVAHAAAGQTNVHYHGWLAHDSLPLYFYAADIIYYCLRLDYPGAVYNAPNTLSQAMAAGRPIIANDVGDLGRIVRSTGCGVLIQEATVPAIVDAVEHLTDADVRSQLGMNGLEAARNQYNNELMKEQLLALYRSL